MPRATASFSSGARVAPKHRTSQYRPRRRVHVIIRMASLTAPTVLVGVYQADTGTTGEQSATVLDFILSRVLLAQDASEPKRWRHRRQKSRLGPKLEGSGKSVALRQHTAMIPGVVGSPSADSRAHLSTEGCSDTKSGDPARCLYLW